MSLIDLLLGRRLATEEQSERKIGVLAGVPALGLDGLASSAYGPEAMLVVLLPLGAAGLRYVGPITAVILALLALLFLSYRQTIAAYPGGGGSYTVAKENLGIHAGLWAAAALMMDYVLNVAVAISAGVAALVSAFPDLHRYTLPLCLATLALIALVNLRGTLESGWAFALPTYLFIGSFVVVLATGIAGAVADGGHPRPVMPPPALPAATQVASLWLLMHAFASGCTAMTGVEAVSNGIAAFREPATENAKRTLTVIVGTLAALLGGIAYLCRAYGIGAMDQSRPGYRSVLSQLVAAVFGQGMFYYVAITSLLAVLCLSANTSFVGFPRLCRLVAADGFLPHAFTIVGRRLVYTVGIVFLSVTSGLLLIVFGGITEHLIPLFAVGAFLAFTLSQAGMVVHWRRHMRTSKEGEGRAGPWAKLVVNGLGTMATGAALAVILVAKFRAGAWITVLAFPILITLFRMVKRYYLWAARKIRTRNPLDLSHNEPPIVVVPTEGWNKLTDKALRFAMRLSTDVISVHLASLEGTDDDECSRTLRLQWAEDVEEPAREAGRTPPRLVVIPSPFRTFHEPLLQFIDQVRREHPDRLVAILVPEVVKQHWWEFLLHNFRAGHLRSSILRRGDRRVVVVSVPWYLEDRDDEPIHTSSATSADAKGCHPEHTTPTVST